MVCCAVVCCDEKKRHQRTTAAVSVAREQYAQTKNRLDDRLSRRKWPSLLTGLGTHQSREWIGHVAFSDLALIIQEFRLWGI